MPDNSNNKKKPLYQRLNRIGNHDAVFIKELVLIFKESLIQSMQLLNGSDSDVTIFEKQQVGHKLRSNFMLFEYKKATDLASNIEKATKTEDMKQYIEELNALIPNILEELSSIK